jgi:hypothetical protein
VCPARDNTETSGGGNNGSPHRKQAHHRINDLDALATSIRRYLKQINKACVTALRIALDAGDALQQAKDQVPDKQWGKWLRDNCFLSVRTAQLYMQLADHRTEIEFEAARFDELSIRQARKLIAKSKSVPEEDKIEPVTTETTPTTITTTTTLCDYWHIATEAEQDDLAATVINTVPVEKLFALMSAERRDKITKRVLGNAKYKKAKTIKGTLAA